MSIEIMDFVRRCAEQQQFQVRQQQQQHERDYTYIDGDYSNPVLSRKGLEEIEDRLERRADLPKVVRAAIDDLLQTKMEPIIVLDIGGAVGKSWRELAASYEREIQQGRLAFVVSNLVTEDPDTFDELAQKRSSDRPFPKSKQLIHSIQSTYADLGKQTITLPTGEVVSLKGNTDIVHERFSLTAWSNIPEMSIFHAAQLLSPVGMYFVPDQDIVYPQNYGNLGSRRNGIHERHNWLQESMGLRRVSRFETGPLAQGELSYSIFKRPAAPLIRI